MRQKSVSLTYNRGHYYQRLLISYNFSGIFSLSLIYPFVLYQYPCATFVDCE